MPSGLAEPAPGRITRLTTWVTRAVHWTRPTSTEVGVVLKSGLAAGLAWWLALLATDLPHPVLAPLTAIVVVQVSARASVSSALQRTAAVVVGVLLALAVGDLLELNVLTVGLVVVASLGVTQLVLRIPPAAARQVPISVFAVLSSGQATGIGAERVLETCIGAAVGVVVSLVLPASRLVDARQTIGRLADAVADLLEDMGAGLQDAWTVEQSEEWRHAGRVARDRLVTQAREATGNSRESARWNVRDRRNLAALARYEDALPRLERTAIGAWVLARGVDDQARVEGTSHVALPGMGALFAALGGAVRALAEVVLDGGGGGLDAALGEVRAARDRVVAGATRRARLAVQGGEGDGMPPPIPEAEWLGYVALLAQVDRMAADIGAHQ